MKMLTLERCPVCGAEDGEAVDLGGGAHRRCPRCGTIRTVEYADPDAVFSDGYFDDASEFGLDSRHPRFQRYLEGVGAQRMAMVEQLTGGPGSLLDVGTGEGEFPAAAAQRGWRVAGVELMAQAAEAARTRFGIDVRTGLLSDAGFDHGSFDVVSAMHVLEHLTDSVAFLHELAAHARPGGYVLIEVPNLASDDRTHTGPAWRGLRPVEHLVQFTPTTLRGAFERAGLTPVNVTTRSWLHPMQSLDEACDDLGRGPRFRRALRPLTKVERGPHGGEHRVPTRPGWAALRVMERALGRRGRGAIVVGIAQRPQSSSA